MDSTSRIKLLIVDDHPVVRVGLQILCELDQRIEIVASAETAQGAREALRTLSPDVVLLDVQLPDESGIELCRAIKRDSPKTKILLLTSYAQNDLILSAMEAAADGYLLKVNNAVRIIEAIDIVLRGGAVFDPVQPSQTFSVSSREGSPLGSLTPQELRVMAHIAEGKTDKETALALELSAKTVRNYLDRIFAKFGVKTRTQAAMLFVRHSRPDNRLP